MKNISVIVRNTTGVVADVSKLLGDQGVNIEEIAADSEGTMGVINLVVDRYDVALQSLRDAGYRAISEDALVIKLKDEPGAFARIALRFKDAGINIRSIRIVHRGEGQSFVAIVTDRTDKAMELVRDVIVSM